MKASGATAVDGRASTITVMTPIKHGHVAGLRMVLFLGEHIKQLNKALEQLSFIHYARWTIIKNIPFNGEPQQKDHLHYEYLFFESNFNGTWDEYIDAFSEVLPQRMQLIWGSSFGFPGPLPVAPFKEYIHKNDLPVAHFYDAYPEATTKGILAAKRLRAAVDAFNAQTAAITDPEEFKTAYLAFLTLVQHDL